MFLRLLSLVAILGATLVQGNVIGIDFGSDSMKVAIVQPGTPLEIVTNFQSKRKTQTCLAFYRGERHFGADGYALIGRKPELTVAKFNRLLGRTADHPMATELKQQYFPYEIYANETTSVSSVKVDTTYYTPEELMAMMLQHAKQLTLNFGGKVIKDCVITVPSSFTPHEKSALFTAATIADLNILSLIEENTAAALHYGIDRVFETPSTVLYYNMGASSVQVTIVTYSSYVVKEGSKNKTIGQFEVIGKAWDDSLGGFNFDVRLADLMANRFNEVWNKKKPSKDGSENDLKQFYRPMTRLRLEANKIKEVLSANNELPVKAEQLHADVDLNTKITRTDFEEACADLFAKLTDPIGKALTMANLTLADVQAVELLGGSVRIPKVKKTLEDYFKESKLDLGQHLNGDEAMALGAAFRAANLSTNFRVRKVGMSEVTTFGVSINLQTLESQDGDDAQVQEKKKSGLFGGLFGSNKKEEGTDAAAGSAVDAAPAAPWVKSATLFSRLSALPTKSKTVNLNAEKDIVCRLHVNDVDVEAGWFPSSADPTLAVYNITGVTAFAREAAAKDAKNVKVHLHFTQDASGLVVLKSAEASAELPLVMELAEENKINTGDVKTESVEDVAAADAASATVSEEEAAAAAAAAKSGEESAAASEKDPKDTKDTKDTKDSSKDKKDSKKDKKDSKKSEKKADKKKADTHLRKVLTVAENSAAVRPVQWTPAMIAESRNRLRALDVADDLRKAKEAALNDLEGYIYSVKNRISDDEDRGELKKVSTEEQRTEVVELANAAEEWLYDDGRDAAVVDYKTKQTEIRRKAEAIFKRYSELTDRPAAVAKAEKQLGEVKKQVDTWAEKLPHITDAEKEKLLETVNKALEWIEEKTKAQESKSAFEDPVFESTDVPLQLKNVSAQFEKLLKKPKPVEKVVPVTNNSTSTNSTETNADTTNSTTTADGEPERVYVKVETDADADTVTSSSSTEEASATGEEKEEEESKEKKTDDEL